MARWYKLHKYISLVCMVFVGLKYICYKKQKEKASLWYD